MEEYIGKVRIDYNFYSGVDLYSDGKVEDDLLDIVQNHERSEYNRIIAENGKWPMIYHLSHIRQNILEWFPFEKGSKVLEIGSGCGAITGMLADKNKSITCVELSKKRSRINAYRNKDKANIEIIVGNFQDIEPNLPMDYDYITLIGVLEYAESYIQDENAYQKFIQIIKRHMNADGKLLIAIENKYGLKYWAGCKEDHVGLYYEGIEGYTTTKGVKTFSKQGLEKLLKGCRLKPEKFYYPYPDYKLPTQIFSEDYLPMPGELNINHLNLDNERILTFDEAKVYDSLIEDGLFEEFANSYLVVASRKVS